MARVGCICRAFPLAPTTYLLWETQESHASRAHPEGSSLFARNHSHLAAAKPSLILFSAGVAGIAGVG